MFIVLLMASCHFSNGVDCLVFETDSIGYFNPDTGQCEDLGIYPCDSECGPCPLAAAEELSIAVPPWGSCSSQCTGQGETACLETPNCLAVYDETSEIKFRQCMEVGYSGTSSSPCEEKTAYECTSSDSCVAIYDDNGFSRCQNEKVGCYGDQDCSANSICNASEICLLPPGCGSSPSTACPAVCYGFCTPAMSSCFGPITCTDVAPSCRTGEVPLTSNGCYTGQCGAITDCEAITGNCQDQVACDLPSPSCPADTTATVANGCYTGQCIPDFLCGSITCSELDEATCNTSQNCTANYTGFDCICDATGCICQSWQFASCE